MCTLWDRPLDEWEPGLDTDAVNTASYLTDLVSPDRISYAEVAGWCRSRRMPNVRTVFQRLHQWQGPEVIVDRWSSRKRPVCPVPLWSLPPIGHPHLIRSTRDCNEWTCRSCGGGRADLLLATAAQRFVEVPKVFVGQLTPSTPAATIRKRRQRIRARGVPLATLWVDTRDGRRHLYSSVDLAGALPEAFHSMHPREAYEHLRRVAVVPHVLTFKFLDGWREGSQDEEEEANRSSSGLKRIGAGYSREVVRVARERVLTSMSARSDQMLNLTEPEMEAFGREMRKVLPEVSAERGEMRRGHA